MRHDFRFISTFSNFLTGLRNFKNNHDWLQKTARFYLLFPAQGTEYHAFCDVFWALGAEKHAFYDVFWALGTEKHAFYDVFVRPGYTKYCGLVWNFTKKHECLQKTTSFHVLFRAQGSENHAFRDVF